MYEYKGQVLHWLGEMDRNIQKMTSQNWFDFGIIQILSLGKLFKCDDSWSCDIQCKLPGLFINAIIPQTILKTELGNSRWIC